MAMTAFLRFQAHVGTTYKRALTKKIPVRDQGVSACPAHNGAFGNAARYHLHSNAQRRYRCVNHEISIPRFKP